MTEKELWDRLFVYALEVGAARQKPKPEPKPEEPADGELRVEHASP